MQCKNCGARLSDNAKVCQNCGAFIDDKDGYVLLTSDDKMFDISSSYDDNMPKKKKKGRGFIWFLSVVLTLLIIGGGAFYYFTNIYNPTPDKPELTFEGGCGIINDDENIVYVLLKEDSKVEYIHGVSLYDYDKTVKDVENKAPVSTDYEYTKSIDSTFRAIFFDLDKLDVKAGENTFTFDMKFSFHDSEEIFSYLYTVTFTNPPEENVADLVFDHSQSETAEKETTAKNEEAAGETAESTTKSTEKSTTAATASDYSYIYNSYWFTEPIQNGEEYIISAIKFNQDGTFVTTNYLKNGTESWKVKTEKGKYKVENGYTVIDNGEATESTYYKIDSENKALYEEDSEGNVTFKLTSRKYNSIKNAEDFFGI